MNWDTGVTAVARLGTAAVAAAAAAAAMAWRAMRARGKDTHSAPSIQSRRIRDALLPYRDELLELAQLSAMLAAAYETRRKARPRSGLPVVKLAEPARSDLSNMKWWSTAERDLGERMLAQIDKIRTVLRRDDNSMNSADRSRSLKACARHGVRLLREFERTFPFD